MKYFDRLLRVVKGSRGPELVDSNATGEVAPHATRRQWVAGAAGAAIGGTAIVAEAALRPRAAQAQTTQYVDTTSNQTIGGIKTFTSPPVVPAASFPESAVANLTTDLAGKAPLAGPFAPTSPGATAPTRYVGGTTSGAPVGGTFTVGDFVVDQTAKIWICTMAGTPGTWVLQAGSGVDLTSNQTVGGIKTFTSAPVVPAGSFPESAVANLTADLAGRAPVAGPFAPTSPGATASSRYVGGTTSGAPVSGTFAVGDFVVDQAGKMWICTAAGAPGTWVLQAGSGVDLTSNQTVGGVKTFTSAPVVPVGAFPESAVASLVDDLAGKQATIPPGTYAETPGGVLTLVPTTPVAALRIGAPSIAPDDVLTRSDTNELTIGGSTIRHFSFGAVGATEGPARHFYARKASGGPVSYYESIESGSFESGLYTDRVWNFGYNRDPNGTKVIGEPMLFLQMETKFRNDSASPFGSEFHLNFGRPADAFAFNRPIDVYMEHVSGATHLQFAGSVAVTGSGDETGRFQIPDGAGPVRISGGQYLQVTMPASNQPPYIFSAIASTGGNLASVDNAGRATFGGSPYTGAAAACITTPTTGDGGMLEYNYAGTRGWRLGPMNSFGGEFVLMTWFNEPFLRIHHLTGRLIACAPAAAPVDATIAKGRFSPWLDESTGELKFRIRRSDGSYVTATIPYK